MMKVLSKRFGLAAVGNAQDGTRRFRKHYLSLRSAQEQATADPARSIPDGVFANPALKGLRHLSNCDG
ncbi:hypothetical protein [Glutamicibacter halophytocola]|uniref:hypothetical protein n=1 Tax=Glutamicibacter halophytocola TaxID=1933880 RepID=UPI0015C56624|nr:hypothetical protein [Glutamicibacter halophytocola]